MIVALVRAIDWLRELERQDRRVLEDNLRRGARYARERRAARKQCAQGTYDIRTTAGQVQSGGVP